MKKGGKPGHFKRNIALALLLALLCVGGVELAACRYFEPEIYEGIVSPVRSAAAAAVDTGRTGLMVTARLCRDAGDAVARLAARTMEQAAAFWEELTTPEEPPVDTAGPSAEPSAAPPATEPPVTELLEQDGRQILTGGMIDAVYFCQTSPEWADKPYGTDTIDLYGCGPTTMAMAVTSLTETDIDPAAMAAWAAENGYWASRSGSYYSIVLGTAKSYGLAAESFPSREADDMLDALRHGKMLVALMGPGHFTNSGHFILIRGATPDGKVLVADSNSLDNSLTLWDAQTILDELSSTRANGAPLWVLWTSGA